MPRLKIKKRVERENKQLKGKRKQASHVINDLVTFSRSFDLTDLKEKKTHHISHMGPPGIRNSVM